MSAREAMSAVILCGGHSRRMGRDKAGLAWGDGTLLDTLLRALSGLDEAAQTAREIGLFFLKGAELAAREHRNLHLLAYHF